MSIPLPTTDLTSVSVGQSGTVDFSNVGISAGGVSSNPANIKNAGTILIFNESGSGLQISFLTSQAGIYLPAGGWQPISILAGEKGFKWTVLYNLPNPPIAMLLVTYYYPGEPIPSVPILGNSPIGGTAATTTAVTLSNESNSVQTLVIDIGQTGHTLLITIYSDGSFTWSVLQSGTAHQVLKAQTSGNPLLIGQAGDNTEIKGSLVVDQTSFLSTTDVFGNLIIENNIIQQWRESGGTARNILSVNSSNDTIFQYLSGQQIKVQDQANNDIVWFSNAGVSLKFGAYGFLVGSMTRISGNVSSCGSGTTISHGLGVTPDLISGTPVGSQPFSATVGIGNAGSSTFQATVGAGSQIDWTAIKG